MTTILPLAYLKGKPCSLCMSVHYDQGTLIWIDSSILGCKCISEEVYLKLASLLKFQYLISYATSSIRHTYSTYLWKNYIQMIGGVTDPHPFVQYRLRVDYTRVLTNGVLVVTKNNVRWEWSCEVSQFQDSVICHVERNNLKGLPCENDCGLSWVVQQHSILPPCSRWR